jgi:hypothetical protein
MHDEFQPGYDWEDIIEKDLEKEIPLEDDFFNEEIDPRQRDDKDEAV